MHDLKEAIQQAKNTEAEAMQNEKVDEVTPVVEAETTVVEEPIPDEASEEDGFIVGDPTDIPESPVTESGDDAEQDPYASLKADIMKTRPEGRAEADAVVPSAEGVDGFKATTLEEWGVKLKTEINKIGIPEESADVEFNGTMEIISRRRKKLLIEEGLNDVELEEAISHLFDKQVAGLIAKYTGKGTTVTLEVAAEDADKIVLTEEQQMKVEKSSKIQLVKVEKKEMPVTKIKKLNKNETKLRYVQGMNTKYISKHSVALPLTGEFVTFRGALFVELLQARAEKGESYHSIASKKASLAYKHYVDGVTHHLKNERNVTVMTYADFVKTFRFHDLDLMAYAVACASSAPMTVANLTCSSCQDTFDKEFPLSSLLDMSAVPEKIKNTFDNIVKNHTQLQYIETLQGELNELTRAESPVTHNIYDMGAPSIDRGISILSLVDENDATEVYIASIALFVHSLFVYDTVNDEYIEFGEDDYADMFEALKLMPQTELSMMHDLVTDMMYTPQFIMTSKCPSCGVELKNDIPVNDLVFFVTPENPVEMKK